MNASGMWPRFKTCSITACCCTGEHKNKQTNNQKAVFFTKLDLWHICAHDNLPAVSVNTVYPQYTALPLYVLFHHWKQRWCSVEPWSGWAFACAPPGWREGRCRRLQDQTRVKRLLQCLDNVLFLTFFSGHCKSVSRFPFRRHAGIPWAFCQSQAHSHHHGGRCECWERSAHLQGGKWEVEEVVVTGIKNTLVFYLGQIF